MPTPPAPRSPRSQPPTLRRILFSAIAALTIGLGAGSVVTGFRDSPPLRLLQGIAIFGAGAAIIGSVVVLAMTRMADWRDPASEEEFEAIVQRAEELAALGYDGGPRAACAGGGDAYGSDDEDEYELSSDEDFKALVRSALDE